MIVVLDRNRNSIVLVFFGSVCSAVAMGGGRSLSSFYELLSMNFESDHYCTKSYFNVSVTMLSTSYRTVSNMANIDRPSFNAELSSVSEFSSVEEASQFCDFLHTVLDKRASPSLRKVITHNSSPWFESIRD